MKRSLMVLTVLALGALPASPSRAGENAGASLGFHITPAGGADDPCDVVPLFSSGDIVSAVCTEPESEFYVWVFVCDASDSLGVAAMEFGIDYDGQDGSGIGILNYFDCSDLMAPTADWPGDGSGTMLCWDYISNCQKTDTGGPTVAGAFHVVYHTPDRLSFVPHPTEEGGIRLGGCDFVVEDLSGPHGVAGFCSAGYSRCGVSTGVTDDEIRSGTVVTRSFPNPFNRSAEIVFSLPRPGPVTVTVHSLTGRLVSVLRNGVAEDAGDHRLRWNGTDDQGVLVAPGIYFYRITTTERSITRKVLRLP